MVYETMVNYGGGGKRQDAARNAAPGSHTDLSFDLGAALTSEDNMKVFVGVDKDDNRFCGKDMAAVLRNIEDACGGQLVWQEWRDKGSYHVINWRSNVDQEIVIYVTEEEI